MNMVPTSGAATFDVRVPLHASTDSPADVGAVVTMLLKNLAGLENRTSHGDILQALAITMGVRVAMARTAVQSRASPPIEFIDVAVEPDAGAADVTETAFGSAPDERNMSG